MKKLRVSVTDRCNFRCVYCMPECPTWKSRGEILTLEELHTIVTHFVIRFEIEQLRLTGGEPLVRNGAIELVSMLQGLRAAGLRRVSLSSNGALLGRFAPALRNAGLDDVNVSLDSLSQERFAEITGGGSLRAVLNGIEAARSAGLAVKVNTVVIRGFNDGELIALADWASRECLPLRLIEFMPLDARGFWSRDKVFSEKEMLARLSERYAIEPLARSADPARYYLLDGSFRLGIISTVSNPFCGNCDRIRLTADGHLFSCLFAPRGVNLRDALRGGDGGALDSAITEAVLRKPAGFMEYQARIRREVGMNVLGG
jgi:cyclic pyranopterin phosphate synthase